MAGIVYSTIARRGVLRLCETQQLIMFASSIPAPAAKRNRARGRPGRVQTPR
jgi:hypothetical protein